jgi:hypothetical protein
MQGTFVHAPRLLVVQAATVAGRISAPELPSRVCALALTGSSAVFREPNDSDGQLQSPCHLGGN